MNTKTLSNRALSVIDQYLHFRLDAVAPHVKQAISSVPYFNNKTVRARASLRATIGKGSPREIHDEVQAVAMKDHIAMEALADESLKKLMVDNGIGIDCSAFAYYVLNAESEESHRGQLDKHIHFVNCTGFIGKIRCSLRPVENCDVATLADDRNSRVIPLKEIRPGDFISMIGSADPADLGKNTSVNDERNHILVVHQVEYQNFLPTEIHFSHAVAYPEDGLYGSGIKQGRIEIYDLNKPLTEERWLEDGKEGPENRILSRAKRSRTEIRRLHWFP